MKRKAGQAPSPSRGSSVRSTSLVPVENSDSTKLEVSESEAPKALATKTPDEIFDISVEKNEDSIIEAPVNASSEVVAAKALQARAVLQRAAHLRVVLQRAAHLRAVLPRAVQTLQNPE